MRYLIVILLLLSSIAYSSIDIQIIYQRNDAELKISAKTFEKVIGNKYPNASISKPALVSDIDFDYTADTLIIALIVHSNPFPPEVQRFGKLMIFLDDISGQVDESLINSTVLTSGDLIKKIKKHQGRKLVIFEGCYPELLYDKSIPNTTWMFSSLADQLSLLLVNYGALWLNNVSVLLNHKSVKSTSIVNYINKYVYTNNKIFNNLTVSEEYQFVNDRSNINDQLISKHYGPVFTF